MKYTVEIESAGGLETSYPGLSAKAARKLAEEEAKKLAPNKRVFISWFRHTDGQHGYLNRDGNHAITGLAW